MGITVRNKAECLICISGGNFEIANFVGGYVVPTRIKPVGYYIFLYMMQSHINFYFKPQNIREIIF